MIKLFEHSNKINTICEEYDIENYTINSDGSIDVDGNVDLYGCFLNKLPLKFGKVSGNFNCANNELSTLDGCPSYVGNDFQCGKNKIISLEGCPNYVGGIFCCSYNKLISLNFLPKYIGSYLNVIGNRLSTLKGIGEKNDFHYFFFSSNRLPPIIEENTSNIKYIIANQEDYGIWNKDETFNATRFDIMMKEQDL